MAEGVDMIQQIAKLHRMAARLHHATRKGGTLYARTKETPTDAGAKFLERAAASMFAAQSYTNRANLVAAYVKEDWALPKLGCSSENIPLQKCKHEVTEAAATTDKTTTNIYTTTTRTQHNNHEEAAPKWAADNTAATQAPNGTNPTTGRHYEVGEYTAALADCITCAEDLYSKIIDTLTLKYGAQEAEDRRAQPYLNAVNIITDLLRDRLHESITDSMMNAHNSHAPVVVL